jgi:hypothetical protein
MGARIGLLVATTLAAAWAWAALVVSGEPQRLVVVPIAVSLALLAFGWRDLGMSPVRGPRVGRLVGLWSTIEMVAIVVTANLLQHFHRFDLEFPVAAIIVGLHFFPLAQGIPVRLYHATGAAFVAAGVVGLVLPAAERPLVVGTSAALILWATALAMSLRARRMATASFLSAPWKPSRDQP